MLKQYALTIPAALALASIIITGTGCPIDGGGVTQSDLEYDAGFVVGFAEDDWYWQGFDDSYDTIDGGPIYYQGSAITYVETPAYDAGYWDGVWYAYNDGYFVCYDYAFTIGFSEGYDSAFYADYLAFLASDVHTEYYDGGWTDGYNDGFSEGRVFGANDYESGLTFDWLDALLDYRSGTDLYFEEVDLGTGVYGPVYLYEYGTDPAAAKALPKTRRSASRSGIRWNTSARKAEESDIPELSYRTLPQETQDAFDQRPASAPRTGRGLTLETTWLERINAYKETLDTTQTKSLSQRYRAIGTP